MATYKELYQYTKHLSILYAEDDDRTANSVQIILQTLFKEVTVVSDGMDAIARATEKQYDIVLLDVEMALISGFEAGKKIKEMYPQQILIFLTAYDDIEYMKKALTLESNEYFIKPLDEEDFLAKLYSLVSELKPLNES